MHSLLYGLIAALTWGLHDFCVRHLSQRLAPAPMLLGSLLAGGFVLAVVIALSGMWVPMSARIAVYALASGAFYALACFGLYKAFAIGPVRLVAPICGAYPMLSFALAAWAGQPIALGQWFATFAVVGGIAFVAHQPGETSDSTARGTAIAWAILGAIGFALTFELGQTAVQAAAQTEGHTGAELPITFLSRLAAIVIVGAWVLFARLPITPLRPYVPVLALMGVLDVTALGLVLAAGGLANPEFASVAASLFGLVTILLAWRFLGERMVGAQWGGVVLVFAGIGWLAAT